MVLNNMFSKLKRLSTRERTIRLGEVQRISKLEKLSERDKDLAKGRKILVKRRAVRQEKFLKTGFAVGQRTAEFRPPVEDFSFQEEVLREMFGRGDHIWGTQMEPVKMYHDLNPRQRGDTGTAELFGF